MQDAQFYVYNAVVRINAYVEKCGGKPENATEQERASVVSTLYQLLAVARLLK